LTVLETKVYLALSKTGKQSMKAISYLADIDRSDVYKSIVKLQKRGIVEQTIGYPNLYEAIPPQDRIRILMRLKKDEYREIENKASDLLQKLADTEEKKTEEQAFRFIMIPEKEIL
jgi:sugar-specific transcriptional regulator TrmB